MPPDGKWPTSDIAILENWLEKKPNSLRSSALSSSTSFEKSITTKLSYEDNIQAIFADKIPLLQTNIKISINGGARPPNFAVYAGIRDYADEIETYMTDNGKEHFTEEHRGLFQVELMFG